MRLSHCGLLALASIAAAPAAHAHVSAEPAQAVAGAHQVVRFRIGHGCDEHAATTALRLELPPDLDGVRPQPKPGWRLDVEHARGADRPATAITWRGRLPADEFDEFAILLRLPEAPGVLYVPAIQTCGSQVVPWTDIPDHGRSAARPTHPAPALRLIPPVAPDSPPDSPPDGGHHH